MTQTLHQALRRAARDLTAIGSDEATLEAELLLTHALHTDRAHLYQRLREPLPPPAERQFESLLQRRLAREPTAYILGRREFYGLDFDVTPAAIIPRPETETLVEAVLNFARPGAARFQIADVGVGCGAIAVALATELPDVRIVAVDISRDALALARRNARRHRVAERIRFVHGDLLAPVKRPVDVIAANLPYVRTADFEAGPPEIREHEPRLGLDGGPDGLDIIRLLLRQAPARLRPGGALFAEIGETQGESALAAARESFPGARTAVSKDLSRLERVLAVQT